MDYRFVQVGSVTVHIPILTEDQKKRRRKALAKLSIELWSSLTDEQRQEIIQDQGKQNKNTPY